MKSSNSPREIVQSRQVSLLDTASLVSARIFAPHYLLCSKAYQEKRKIAWKRVNV
jgi:hypothetical protein